VTTAVSFTLPPANEATTTPERRGLARDGVRLLVTDIAKRTQHDASFRELPWFLRRGDLLVVNDSATLPAALLACRADAALLARRAGPMSFPLHLSTQIGGELWIAEPRAPVAAGERAALADGGSATFLTPVDPDHPRLWYTMLSLAQPLDAFLTRHGTPIRYKYVAETLPLGNYQTIFARIPGSAEMPSAGRPFSQRSLDDLRQAGVAVTALTLHTGVSSPERHERPYREWFEVPASTAAAVNAARERGGRVIAVGTTVVRALESAVSGGEAAAASGWTDLIVTPERGVAVVDGLVTGFHEPEASHLDLLRAFADDALLQSTYAHALGAGYLWHEFGDVHLLL
jgi:S-adenosylmethionine:tRNA ribosyltransferase-isomerase